MSIRFTPRGAMAAPVLFTALCCFAFMGTQAQAGSSPSDPYAAILVQHCLQPDAGGITVYLRSLVPDRDRQQTLALVFEQLGSADFHRRDAAMQKLIEMPVVPALELRQAADSDQVEMRIRARQVLSARSAGSANSSLVVACFRTIQKSSLKGMAPLILQILPLYSEEFVQSAGNDALRATCTAGDLALLRAAMKSGPVEARAAATATAAHLMGNACRDEMRRLIADPEPRVQLAAALALAHRGDRTCLPPLVELLSCNERRVRHVSAATLRALTGRSSDYVAWIEPDEQAEALKAWKSWLLESGATASLKYPLKTPEVEIGRTLVCLYARNEVVEVDSAGRQTFSASESGACPWACQGLPSGGRIVALYSTNTVVEYGSDGKEERRITVPGGPMSVQRLDNGNTLLACNNAQKVVEVDGDGKVAWEISVQGGPCDAQRLENGNTLVTLQNSNTVVEVDSAGKELWKLADLRTPRTASRLDNGNTLVCDLGSGRIVEFDPGGREVWSQDGFSSPFSAQRLSTGTTLVSDTESVKEIDHGGKVIWEHKMTSLGRVFRY